MALGTFTLSIDGDRIGGDVETTAYLTLRPQNPSGVIKDSDADKFFFKPVSKNISLPYTIDLPTDVASGGGDSAAIGFHIDLTTVTGARISSDFAAKAAGSTVSLTDVVENVVIPVADSMAAAARAESAATAADTSAGLAEGYANDAEDAAASVPATTDAAMTQVLSDPESASAGVLNAAIGASLPAVAHPPRPRITWIETFQVGHGWTNPLPSGSLTDDPAEFVIGTQSLKITDGAAQRQGLTVDLTAAMPVVMLREDAMPANGSIVLYAATDSTFANYYQWTIEGSADGSRWFREDEWVLVTLPLSDAAVIGAPTPAGVTLLRIRASGNAGVTFHANGIGTTPEAASTARLSITMDDGYDDWLTVAREHLTPRGLAATGFLIPDLVGSPGFLSTDQIGELSRNHGWDFEAHGADVYVGMTQEQMRSEWSTTKAWFVAQGLRPPSHLAYVGGQNDALVAKTAREFFATARTISARQAETVPPGDPMRLRAVSSIGFSASANVAAINAAIDKAITGGTHLILVFHQFVDGAPTVGTQCSWTDFDSILDHAIASGIEIDTIAGFFG